MKPLLFILLITLSSGLRAQKPDSLHLQKYTSDQLYQDYDLVVSSLKEAHTGLYWYNTKEGFEKFTSAQRTRIRAGMTGLDFYTILAPLIAFSKEGHTSLRLGKQLQYYMRYQVKYPPCFIKIIGTKLYLINELGALKTKGCELISINDISAQALLRRFMDYEPSDGFNLTGKFRWIEENAKFNTYYARCFPDQKQFTIRYKDSSGKSETVKGLPGLDFEQFRQKYNAALKEIPNSTFDSPASLHIDSDAQTAVLTFNSFQKRRYTAAKMDFHDFVKNAFEQIRTQKIDKLIIDIRRNGGGTEGYEDYLLSFMISKDYQKYKYVQASALHYSFYPFTDYKNDWAGLDSALNAEHYLDGNGKFLRKPGIEAHEKPQLNPYQGRIAVLISGLTYSGGSEFASLMKNYTNAIFIGEETSGGYYGNTSGYRITLGLPNTGLEIAIPILKFVVNTPKNKNPIGHGIIPDYPVEREIEQYLQGTDIELSKAREILSPPK